jgi:hypothetical protein
VEELGLEVLQVQPVGLPVRIQDLVVVEILLTVREEEEVLEVREL